MTAGDDYKTHIINILAMEETTILIIIISIIFGILSLILFFKVWVMTNNVSKIKKHLILNDYKSDMIRRSYLKGETYILKDILDNLLIDYLLKIKPESDKYKNAQSTFERFEEIYKIYGLEIPENVQRLKHDNTDITPPLNSIIEFIEGA